MLNIGIKGHREITVEEKDLAIHVGSGTVHVLATPMMIANMEYTAASSVEAQTERSSPSVSRHTMSAD